MKDSTIQIIVIPVLIIIALVIITVGIGKGIEQKSQAAYEAGYLAACKDFYKGKVRYDLITNPDGTSEWKEVSK